MIENSLPQQHKNTPETASVVDAIIGEVELLFERKEDVIAQLTLDTATWGLAWWEEKFGLLTDLAKPYDHRRSCIRAKMRGAGTTTVAMLQNMAESFTNGEVEIVELTRQYKIIFRFVGSQGIPPNIEDLGASIREAIPAHIEYGFSYTYVTHEELAGLTHEQMQQMTHEQIRSKDIGDEAKASVTDTFAVVEQTSGYSLPLPLKTDNYNIAVVNQVTQSVDAALVEHRDQISPSVGKEAPADADWIVLADSTDRFKRVKLLWSKVVDFMKTVFYTKEESDTQNANIGQSIPLNDVSDTAVTHRNSFRGKNLGTVVTAAQKSAIRNGSFDDLWLGDYWVIGGRIWRIVDINYWLNCGDIAVPPSHLVIMPDACLYYDKMNETNITTGGYVGSKMYTEGLAQAKTMIASAFPGIVISHRELLVNAVANGYPTAGAWYDSTVELPNEIMMYGSHVFAPAGNGTTIMYLHTINDSQLALMAAYPRFIKTRESYWLRDVVSAARFAVVVDIGDASCGNASFSVGVRPVFAIG